MMKLRLLIVALALMLGLEGCIGLAARTGAQQLFGEKEKPPAQRIATAQESAISAVHGGSPGTPIAWSDTKSGIDGALTPTAGGEVPTGCRGYQETVVLAGETLQGRVVACAQNDGSWKLFQGTPQARQ
jgi:surface antigen